MKGRGKSLAVCLSSTHSREGGLLPGVRAVPGGGSDGDDGVGGHVEGVAFGVTAALLKVTDLLADH